MFKQLVAPYPLSTNCKKANKLQGSLAQRQRIRLLTDRSLVRSQQVPLSHNSKMLRQQFSGKIDRCQRFVGGSIPPQRITLIFCYFITNHCYISNVMINDILFLFIQKSILYTTTLLLYFVLMATSVTSLNYIIKQR